MRVGLDPDFSAKITKGGIYTLTHKYFVKENQVYGKFSIHNGDELVGETSDIDMKVTLDEVTTRRYIWFSDISLENGLVVGTPNYPTEEPPKQEAPALSPSDWITDGGQHGSVDIKSDNKVVLKGSESASPDGTRSGPYINVGSGHFDSGAISDEIHIYIDPQNMSAGEKFAITSSIDGKNDEQLAKLSASFTSNGNGELEISLNLDPSFSETITQAGLYTIKYTFVPGETIVFGEFSVEQRGVRSIVQSKRIPIYDAPRELAKGRGAVWFNDISVKDGLEVYSVTEANYSAVDEALQKVPQELEKYTDESVERLNNAITNVKRGLDITRQDEVDEMAKAIEEAIALLEEKKEETTNPEDTTKPDDTTNPEDTTKPEDDNSSEDSENQESTTEDAEESGTEQDENVPSAGDTKMSAAAALVGLFGSTAVIIFAAVTAKKKEEKMN